MTDDVILTAAPGSAACIDLRATCGRRFRYEWDPSYEAERSDRRAREAAWLTAIPCKRRARIFPRGGRRLAAFLLGWGQARRALEGLAGVQVVQGGGRCPEIVVAFDVAELEVVANLLGASRPRIVSAEQIARLKANTTPYRFRKTRGASASLEGPETTIAHRDDSGAGAATIVAPDA